ncbi:hypothetical protein ABGB18_08735 [Nonomuraea sp. B12E4]|uniref:hypothetical protein n=1 Tax=Nonomuraea sp. B12E4 TaxID=3153564 RepID=UPI00325F75BC
MVMTITPPGTSTSPPPVGLLDGPGGLLYLLPHAPLTIDDCETLAAALAARVAAARGLPSPAAG